MKKITLLKSFLLLCALIVGSNSVWAQSDKSAVYTSNVTLSETGGTKATSSTIVINSTNYNAMKLGSSGNGGSFKVTFPAGTKYIHLHVAAWNGKNSNTLSFSGITKYTPSDAITLTANTGISGSSSTYTFSTSGTNSAPNSTNHYKVITLETALASNTEVTLSCSERCVIWGVNSEEESSTFNVTYNANGADSGVVPEDDTDYAKNATVTVLGNTGNLAKTHYYFDGWNTKANGTGMPYEVEESFEITNHTTLYAQWSPNTHDVSMPSADIYGDYAADETDDVPYGSEVTLTYTPASGYESYIAKWSVNGVGISGNTFDMPDEDVAITVSIEPNPYIDYDFSAISDFSTWTATYGEHTVTYDDAEVYFKSANKQSGTITDIPVTKGSDVKLTLRNSGETLKSVKFVCRQWDTKEQTITLNYSTDGGSNFSALTPSVTSTNFTIQKDNLPVGTNAVKLTFSSSTNQIGIESATIEIKVPVTIGASKYASYCSARALNFRSTDVKAYKAKVDAGKVVLTEVDYIPANEGVVLYGEEGNYDVPVIGGAPAVTENEMIGVTSETSVVWNPSDGVYNYILQQGTFKKASDGKLRANRAYLSTSYDVTTAGARELVMVFEGEEGGTTGIATANVNLNTNDNYFDLQGRKIAKPTKGLYIVNGKKVVIK